MTEQTWTEENILASDVWRVEKSIKPMSDEEQLAAWRKTVKVLDGLCGLSDTLMFDPLILALTDALMRAKEELARAEDRLGRPEGAELHPREEKRLRGMLERSNALGYAHTAVSDEEWAYPDLKAAALEILEEMRKETDEQFDRYKQEVGVSD